MVWDSLLQAGMFRVQGLLARLPRAEHGSCGGNPRVPSSPGAGDVLSPPRALGLRDAVPQAALLGGNCCVGHAGVQEMKIEGMKSLEGALPFRGEDWLFP